MFVRGRGKWVVGDACVLYILFAVNADLLTYNESEMHWALTLTLLRVYLRFFGRGENSNVYSLYQPSAVVCWLNFGCNI